MAEVMWAKVTWADEQERKRFFAGNVLSSLARFDSAIDNADGWSLMVELVEAADETNFFWGKVRFLVETAPHELLHEGQTFELLAGARPILKGIITIRKRPLTTPSAQTPLTAP